MLPPRPAPRARAGMYPLIDRQATAGRYRRAVCQRRRATPEPACLVGGAAEGGERRQVEHHGSPCRVRSGGGPGRGEGERLALGRGREAARARDASATPRAPAPGDGGTAGGGSGRAARARAEKAAEKAVEHAPPRRRRPVRRIVLPSVARWRRQRARRRAAAPVRRAVALP